MDTAAIKAQIKAGEAQPRHDQSGMTKLLVAIPLDLRTGLADLSAESGVSQREIIRQAVRRLWEDGSSAIQVNARTSTVKTAKAEKTTVKAKAAKTVCQVTTTASISHPGQRPDQHGQDRQGREDDCEGQGCEGDPPGHAHGLHREDRQ